MSSNTVSELINARPTPPAAQAVLALDREGLNELTRTDLLEQAGRFAGGLLEAGLQRGDRVALVAPNSIDWVIAAVGVMQAGGVLVPIDTQMPLKEFHYVLEDAAPRWVLTSASLADRVRQAELDPGPELRLLDADEADAPNWRKLWAEQPRKASVAPEDFATMFCTSGTTGPPKGVPLTHANLTSNVESLVELELTNDNDRILVPLPFHHVYPFTLGILVPLRLGIPLIIPYSLVGPQIVRALQVGKPTIMLGVPRLYEAIWSALQERVSGRGALAQRLFHGMLALSMQARRRLGWRLGRRLFRSLHQRLAPQLRLVVAGGAALDPELAEKLQGLGWEVATGYGLSETSPILTFNPPDRLRVRAAGLALPGVELRIDPPGGRGEVMARGANVFSGYWQRPEKTAEALDEDGWFRTGDLGEFDGDGYLYLHGRSSAMIVLSGGENIDPERVEETLKSARGVRDIGILEHKDRLVAVVVPEPSAAREYTGEELHSHLRESLQEAARSLPSHHRPSQLQVSLDPLPRTRLGKLRRHELRRLYESLAAGGDMSTVAVGPMPLESMAPEDQQLLSDSAAAATWHYLADKYKDIRLTPDSSLSLDLGLDSLAWVNLSLSLGERAQVDLDDEAIGRIETVRDLLREAAAARHTEEGGADLVTSLRQPDDAVPERLRVWLQPRGTVHRACGRIIVGLIRALMPLWVRVDVHGRLPEEGPLLITPRHLSALDPVVIAQALSYEQLRKLRWTGWTGMVFRSAVGRWFSRVAGVLPVDPAAAPRNSLALAAAALSQGHNVVWFPEGARSPDGTLQPFQPGIGLLLRAQPHPVVPISIEGTDQLLPIGRRFPRRGRVRVIIGEPVSVERLQAAGDDEQAIARLIHDEVKALSERAGER
ncbi:AMP-binding protein [Aquisalimonas sp.]|uniref:AMP-binding protein n=1 Tax=Aquisalimonas sp. TaxID=1872621 RepID=UPI0025BDCA5E|nr:AMP-binding protein [Aquisalimonas sp.]